ncbi:MAG: two-component sensor histidine kinase, partial [Sorangium cellulosum]
MTLLVQRIRHAKLPLVSLLPAIVLVVGVSTAITAGFLGLVHLRSTSDNIATDRAAVLSATLAARIRATSSSDHLAVVRRAARRSGAEILIAAHDGRVLADGTFGAPTPSDVVDLLVEGQGEADTRIGRTKFSATPIGTPFRNLAIIVFVPAPLQPDGAFSLVRSVVFLTALLLGVAVVVAFLFTRELRADVDFVRGEIEKMAQLDASPVGTPIAIRMIDQVGALTHAFNLLIDRFAA